MGDFADVPVEGTYRLIHVVFNTLFNLLTQQEQAWCFENVASHLTKDLLSVVEAFVPSYLNRLRDDQYVDAEHIGVGSVRFDVGRHDSVAQRLDETRVVLSPEGGLRPRARGGRISPGLKPWRVSSSARSRGWRHAGPARSRSSASAARPGPGP